MKKLKLLLLIAGALSMWQLKAQTTVPPLTQTIAIGDQYLTGETATSTTKWYSLQNTNTNLDIILDIAQQGLGFRCNQLQLFANNTGSLELLSADTLYGGTTLEVFTKNLIPNTALYLKVISLNLGCLTCLPNNSVFNLKVLNLAPGCLGYVQPNCEFVKDGGFEFFNNPCSTIQIIEDIGGSYSSQFAPCFWNLPLGNDPGDIGSPDYYTACASPLVGSVGGATNAFVNLVSGSYSSSPHNGDSYIGMYLCAFGSVAIPEYREYFSQPLATPIVLGNNYKIGMYVRLSRNSGLATSNIQALLSNGTPTQIGKAHIAPAGQLINITTTAITNLAGWSYITVNFLATGNYSNLTIGNFQDDATTTTIPIAPTASYSYFSAHDLAYYFFDDVSIVEQTNFTVPPLTYTFCLNAPPTITLSVIPPVAGITYTWASSPSLGVLTGTSIVITPTTSINFTITSSAGGCANTVFTSVNLIPALDIPALIASPAIVCPTSTFNIFLSPGSSSSPFGSYYYTILPGGLTGIGGTFGPVPTYTSGINTYTINMYNIDFCTATTTLSVYVPINPYPSYTLTPNPVCIGAAVTLTASNILVTPYGGPGIPGNGLYVDWGDGIHNFVNASSNTHIYTSTGTFTIFATGAGLEGCSDTSKLVVNVVNANPQFTVGTISCQELLTCFNNTSGCTLPTSQWLWTVTGVGGFSQTSINQNLCQTFPATGIYTVCLQQDNGFGLSPAFCQTVLISSAPAIAITNTVLSLCNLPVGGLVTLNPNVILGATGTATWVATDNITGAALTIPFTTSTNGIITYNLTSYTTYTAPINFCVNLTVNGCNAYQCVTIYPCCPTATGTVLYSDTVFSSPTILAGPTKYRFSGTIIVNDLVQISATDVTFDPNTKIIVKPNGTLEVFQSYLHGCSAMWDGIYLYQGCTLKIYQSNTIEDAKRAVVDTLGANDIHINSTLFNKNYESIVLKRTNTTPTLLITNNLFSCDVLPVAYTTASPAFWGSMSPTTIGALAPTFMLPPYISRKSYSGITLYQTKTSTNPNQFVQIAGNNLFDKLQFGIVATRSRFVVQYNTFQNITAGKGLHAAIYIYGKTGVYPPYLPEAKIGGTPLEGNTFSNCSYGIYNQYGSILSILNNTLTTINRDGIFITKNIYNVVIDKNKLNQCLRGINLFDNGRIKADVTNNRIVNATTVGIYNNNYGIFVGEVIPATSASSIINRYHNIYNNYIEGYYNGMYVSNTYSTQIVDNEVHIMADNAAGNFQMGIRVEGTNKINIKNNIVDKPLADNSAWWQYGIFLDGNTIPAIKCNSINNFYASVKFQMLNYVAPGNGLTFNVFDNFYHGVWLDQNAEIGDQYTNFPASIHKASMNQWQGTGFFSQTYVTNHSNQNSTPSSGVASKIYTLPSTSGAYYLNNSFAFRDGFTTGLFTELKGAYTYPSLYVPCPASIPTPLMFRSANIALNNLSYGINALNLVHVSNRMLVKNIKTEGINLSLPTNALYKNFIDSTYTTSVGQFYRVDSLLNLGISTGSVATISQAKLLNTSISTPNLLEQNQKWLNAIYIDMQTAEPDTSILLMLEQLAIKCPQYDGEAVYQARSLLMYYFGKSYNSICDVQNIQPSGTRLANPSINNSEPTLLSVSVYPNPTTKDITVTYTKGDDNESAIFEVYNMVGELVLNQTLNENITKLSLSDLSSGIYIYFIKQEGITLQTNKLVLTK